MSTPSPWLEKGEIAICFKKAVFVVEPTVMAPLTCPGVTVETSIPLFPAAMTTVISASMAARTASSSAL